MVRVSAPMFLFFVTCLLGILIPFWPPLFAVEPSKAVPYQPAIEPRTDEGVQAIGSFRVPEGQSIQLVAAEPDLANPVAFCIDEQGRFYICETFRQKKGVEDNRGHMYWLLDDLKAETVADRVAYMQKHHADAATKYTVEQDRIRLLTDTDGDGIIDQASLFADGFHDIATGTGAGVFAFNGNVYYTCIPDLWMLKDSDNDEKADQRESVASGFGVRFAFRGHDMHGLALGPDGRIYFSIGDRGYNVMTKEGAKLYRPGTGAVFRCERDGSHLEEFAYGLRNPQELAFDDFGNLFTGDNNSDSGDKARWVHVCEGGDSGWRMEFQYLSDRGPWNRERMWYPFQSDAETTGIQPAYIIPPIANLGDGPSGLVSYYGVGLPERYRGHFFMADFRGQSANSGIRSFANQAKGAGFELVDSHEYLWSTLVTDVDFGFDGQLYFTDWVNGWDGLGKGRLYRSQINDEELKNAGQEVAKLFQEGFSQRTATELSELLAHPDRRVRLWSQIELAERKQADALLAVAGSENSLMARIHAIQGLGEIFRQADSVPYAKQIEAFARLLHDPEPEVIAQTCQVLGEISRDASGDEMTALLADESDRVRYFAALNLGKIGYQPAIPPLLQLLAENQDQDPILRHAAVMGLAGAGVDSTTNKPVEQLLAAATDPQKSVRLGILLALRKMGSPAVSGFLTDGEPAIVLEAARAIHDLPLEAALPTLAAIKVSAALSPELIRRVMSANYLLGGSSQAETVIQLAANTNLPVSLRMEAVTELKTWGTPEPLDRVTNRYRELPARPADFLSELLRPYLGGLMNGPARLQEAVIELASQYGIEEIVPTLLEIVSSDQQATELRVSALNAIQRMEPEAVTVLLEPLLTSVFPELRTAARQIIIEQQPQRAVNLLTEALNKGTVTEQQSAITQLAQVNQPEAKDLLQQWAAKLFRGDVPLPLHLELLETLPQLTSPELTQTLINYQQQLTEAGIMTEYQACLEGGNAIKGAELFFGRADTSCRRCHEVNGEGGGVGPDLSEIAKNHDRAYLLESIIHPDAKIAKGFETVLVVTIEGKIVSGIVKEETDEALTLVKPMGEVVRILQDDIEDRAVGKSGMPGDFTKSLSRRELRDLVEYLTTLKQKQVPTDHGRGEHE